VGSAVVGDAVGGNVLERIRQRYTSPVSVDP
jgi:hypothetical protein